MKLVFHFDNQTTTEFDFDDINKLIKAWDYLRNNMHKGGLSVFNNTIINLSKVVMVDIEKEWAE